MIEETTDPSRAFERRLTHAAEAGLPFPLSLLAAVLVPERLRGRVGFRTRVPVEPAAAHELVRAALLAAARTRVLTEFPEPIVAMCFNSDFPHTPLVVEFELVDDGDGGTVVDAGSEPDGLTRPELHDRRRRALRRIVEEVAARGGEAR